LSDAGVASPAQLGDARRASGVAEADISDAYASLEQAQRDLERTEILAPFDGRVREENVDSGEFVGRGNPVARIYATDYVEIRLPIPDDQFAYLDFPDPRRSGDGVTAEGPVVILRSAFAGQMHEWTGRVVRTEGAIDARSRMVHVVARVEKPYDEKDALTRPPLAVGLFVEAEILGPEAQNVIVVPRYAMRDASEVLIVDAEDQLYTKHVNVLRIDRDDVLVQGPLDPGERICVSPIQVVVEGMRVQTVADEADEADKSDEAEAVDQPGPSSQS
jgi:RND family efflux transporter MFP subunit